MGCGVVKLLNTGAVLPKPEPPPRIEGRYLCVIPEAHLRGITLDQVKRLYVYTVAKCRTDPVVRLRLSELKHEWHWHDSCGFLDRGNTMQSNRMPPKTPSSIPASSSSASSGEATVVDFNHHGLVEVVIKDVTQERACSYVEFTSEDPGEQMPCWFVSHFWGEPVKDFISCLELFHARHDLRHTTPFWICAYALRQHQLGLELGHTNPMEEPFAKALASPHVRGTAVIMDAKLKIYRRAWCCFETVLTILLNKRLDLVVTHSHMTYMIADGLARGDGDISVQEARDQEFPLEVAEKGMELTIELSTTTQLADKNRILNAIATSDISNETPPLFHPNYEFHNAEIRKKFAAVMLRVATANGNSDGVRRALHQSPAAQHVWHNAEGQSQQEVAEVLAQRFPDDQERLDIVAYFREASRGAASAAADAAEQAEGVEARPKSFTRTNTPFVHSLSELSSSISSIPPVPCLRRTSSFQKKGVVKRASIVDPINEGDQWLHPESRRWSTRTEDRVTSRLSGVSELTTITDTTTTAPTPMSCRSRSGPGRRPLGHFFGRLPRPRVGAAPSFWGLLPPNPFHTGSSSTSKAVSAGEPAKSAGARDSGSQVLSTLSSKESLDLSGTVAPQRSDGDDTDDDTDTDTDGDTFPATAGDANNSQELDDTLKRSPSCFSSNSAVHRFIENYRAFQIPEPEGGPVAGKGRRRTRFMLESDKPGGHVCDKRMSVTSSTSSSVMRWVAENRQGAVGGPSPSESESLSSCSLNDRSVNAEAAMNAAQAMVVRSAAAERAGSAGRIVQWMRENRLSAEVQEEGCRHLGAIASLPGGPAGGAGGPAEDLDLGTVDSISEVLSEVLMSHPNERSVQIEACRAIWRLTSNNEVHRQHANATSLIKALALTLKTHRRHKRVWVEAILAHRALCPEDAVCPQGSDPAAKHRAAHKHHSKHARKQCLVGAVAALGAPGEARADVPGHAAGEALLKAAS